MSGQVGPGVWLREGRLYIDHETHEHSLYACPSVGLMIRDEQWWLVPLRVGISGLQVKQRNARGDRVVESQEFFRNLGVGDDAVAREMQLIDKPDEGIFQLVFHP